jgi:hypothetical protein
MYMYVHGMYNVYISKTRIYLYKHVHTRLNDVHICLYIKMNVHVYTMYIHVYIFSERVHVYTFHENYVHV